MNYPSTTELDEFIDDWWRSMRGFAPGADDQTVYSVFEFVAKQHFIDFARDLIAHYCTTASNNS